MEFTYDKLISLNSEELNNLDLTITGFFTDLPRYNITKDMRLHYPNNYNLHFNRKRVRPKVELSSDPQVLKNLRSCLSKITEANFEKMVAKIVKILTSENYDWKDLASNIYQCVIDNIFLVNIFVKLVVELEDSFPDLIRKFHRQVIGQFKNPKEFKDTLTETGPARTKRWKISNAQLIMELYEQKRYSADYIQKVISTWVNSIEIDNLDPLEIMVKLMPKINKKVLLEKDKNKLQQICKDKQYPNRLRLLLNLPRGI